jgi:hypothetical protein
MCGYSCVPGFDATDTIIWFATIAKPSGAAFARPWVAVASHEKPAKKAMTL